MRTPYLSASGCLIDVFLINGEPLFNTSNAEFELPVKLFRDLRIDFSYPGKPDGLKLFLAVNKFKLGVKMDNNLTYKHKAVPDCDFDSN